MPENATALPCTHVPANADVTACAVAQRKAARQLAKHKPLVYSCSGCSSAAQMANHLALSLDSLGVAEMSCIAGIGGKVAPILRIAHSGRLIVALDGCKLSCVRETLKSESLEPHTHVRLDLLGVKKRKRMAFDRVQAERILDELCEHLN